VFVRVELFVSARILDGLEGDAADALERQGVIDDGGHLLVVQALLDGTNERGRNIRAFQGGKRVLPHFGEIGAAQGFQRLGIETVELQVNFQTDPAFFQFGDKARIRSDAHAVGVDHEMTNGALPCHVDDPDDFRMQGRLAAGQLQEIRFTFARDQCIHHPANGCQIPFSRGSFRRFGKTDRAGEIAGLVDFDDRKAGMLFMVGTQATIVWAAIFSL